MSFLRNIFLNMNAPLVPFWFFFGFLQVPPVWSLLSTPSLLNCIPQRPCFILTNPANAVNATLYKNLNFVFLRDIELIATERNRGLGSAIVRAVLALARAEARSVELFVLACNPAQHLYARLGFCVVGDDGARLTMRAS